MDRFVSERQVIAVVNNSEVVGIAGRVAGSCLHSSRAGRRCVLVGRSRILIACSIACMDQNDFQVKEGQRPFRNVFDLEMEQKGEVKYSHLSLACMHCSDAPCITACPSACLRKDPETNLTVYDTTNCIGCHSCAMACPYGIPSFGENGKMIKCDGCYVRVHHGMLPACVKACPVKALQLVDTEAKEPQIPPEHSLRMTSAGMLKQQV